METTEETSAKVFDISKFADTVTVGIMRGGKEPVSDEEEQTT